MAAVGMGRRGTSSVSTRVPWFSVIVVLAVVAAYAVASNKRLLFSSFFLFTVSQN